VLILYEVEMTAMRRVLVTIPHVYNPAGDPRYSSSGPAVAARVEALGACITALRQNFGSSWRFLNHEHLVIEEVGRTDTFELDIVICTTGQLHLLPDLDVPTDWYEPRSSLVDPMMVGFECHEVLRERFGSYDCYCYLEDDIVVHDVAVFKKVEWFADTFGARNVLGPHRYERTTAKLYIDGHIPVVWTSEAQDITNVPCLDGVFSDRMVRFWRPRNPHSGCFILTAEQFERWLRQPYFLDRDVRFVGPLESAATLGIMKAFRLYKSNYSYAEFFEVEHHDSKWSTWATTACRSPGDEDPVDGPAGDQPLS
jgi:hypothetical protein